MGAGHTHSDGHEPHGGARSGLGWELLDSIVAACAVALVILLAELLYRAWRERSEGVRYDLTPKGAAVTESQTGPETAPSEPETAVQTD